MAAKKEKFVDNIVGVEDFTNDLIKQLNKEFGSRLAYNLSEMDAPTIVKRWFTTGSRQLDYCIRNLNEGGYPEGRIIEITGLPSSGKSHLAYATAAHIQSLGGLVVYIDSENATPIAKLAQVGINIKKRFVYIDSHCTEEIFSIIERTILKAKQIQSMKDVPILVIWDSVAATSPKQELEGEYDQTTMGLNARIISKGMRKITGILGQNNVTLICINQLRDAIGVMHGDPLVSPGGKSIPYHASVRIRLGSGTQVKNKDGQIVGIHVIATIKKNKVGPPFRKCEFDIIFGHGIVEHEYIFDEIRSHCEKHKVFMKGSKKDSMVEIKISGTGAWKEFVVIDTSTGEVILDKKFHKADFGQLMIDSQFKPFIDKLIEATYIINTDIEDNDQNNANEENESSSDE